MKPTLWIPLLLTTMILPAHAAKEADPEPGEILARLQSENRAEVAWGAYLAGKHGVKAAIPLLIDWLRPHPNRGPKNQEYAVYAVLDGLIRLDAKVPGYLLLLHARGKGWKPAIILLAREAAKNREGLLALFRRSRPVHLWNGLIAIGNLLCAERAPGFAADLLGRIPFVLHLMVTDPDSDTLFGAGSSIGIGTGDGIVRLPDGFPPYARYLYWNSPKQGSKLLADGPHPVWYTRMEYEKSGLATGIDGWRLPARTCATEWLGVLLGRGIPEDAIPKKGISTVRFHSDEEYVEQAVAARDKLLAPWRALVLECIEREIVSRAEAAKLTPVVEVTVSDKRTDRTRPLPAIPADTWRPLAENDGK